MSAASPPPEPQHLLPLSAAVLSILLALADGEKHGYAIMKQVALSEGGSLSMGPGTLYGTLDRMLRSHLIEETGFTDDERRRYYRLTGFGNRVLIAEATRLKHLLATARQKRVFSQREA